MKDPRAHPVVRTLVAIGCAYECGAIVTNRAPTLSCISRKHRWLAPILMVALAADLYAPLRTAVVALAEETL